MVGTSGLIPAGHSTLTIAVTIHTPDYAELSIIG